MLEISLILIYFTGLPALLGYITSALSSSMQPSWYASISLR